jgi:hypothetical protein
MQNLQDVYNRLQEKKKEHALLAKSFQDELKSSPRYQEIVETMKKLREEKKSLENAAKSAAILDATKMDTLKLDMKSDRETLTDIALTMYAASEEVKIVDRESNIWVPAFSVKFTKEESGAQELQDRVAAVNTETAMVNAAADAEEDLQEVSAESAELQPA